MPTYNCRCINLRNSVPTYHTTDSFGTEKEVVDDVIDYLTVSAPFPEPFLVAEYYMQVEERSGVMAQEDYNMYMKSVINTFQLLVDWCVKYDKYHDFNNFETGWSVSMSMYS